MTSVGVPATQVLLQIFASSESFASASNAIGMGAEERSSSWANAFLVHLAHMP